MKRTIFLTALMVLMSTAYTECGAQMKSVDEASRLSSGTGRPIFAVIGSET